MSHNVTLSAMISPTQLLAVEALAGGSSVTAAAKTAGVARETVSRWVHHDPIFLAELHNTRAELAAQTRYALEALGMKAVATLCEALQDQRHAADETPGGLCDPQDDRRRSGRNAGADHSP